MRRAMAIISLALLTAIACGCAATPVSRPAQQSCFDSAVDHIDYVTVYRRVSTTYDVFAFDTSTDLMHKSAADGSITGRWLAGEEPFVVRAVQKQLHMQEHSDDTPIDEVFAGDIHTMLAERRGERIAMGDMRFAYESHRLWAADVDGDGVDELFIKHSVGRGTGANIRWLTAWRVTDTERGLALQTIFRTPVSGYIPTATSGMPRGGWLRVFCARPDPRGGLQLVSKVFRSAEPDPALSDGVESLAWEVSEIVYAWDEAAARIAVRSLTQ